MQAYLSHSSRVFARPTPPREPPAPPSWAPAEVWRNPRLVGKLNQSDGRKLFEMGTICRPAVGAADTADLKLLLGLLGLFPWPAVGQLPEGNRKTTKPFQTTPSPQKPEQEVAIGQPLRQSSQSRKATKSVPTRLKLWLETRAAVGNLQVELFHCF